MPLLVRAKNPIYYENFAEGEDVYVHADLVAGKTIQAREKRSRNFGDPDNSGNFGKCPTV